MKWGRVSLVIFGALVITALGIDAADTLNGSTGTLLSKVIREESGICPKGMSIVENSPTITCVDTYEASPSENCPVPEPGQTLSTLQNIESRECTIESKPDVLPWRFVTRDQAMQLCARVGKRIPTSAEWYALSLGMTRVEDSCNVSSKNVSRTGAHNECITPHGAFDMVGNVWEWVSDDVIDGKYNESNVPESGYIAQVDASGIATVSSAEAQDLFGKDYFWSRTDGAYGIIRGGYYDSGSDGGVYTAHADTLPTSASIGIGFRCVK